MALILQLRTSSEEEITPLIAGESLTAPTPRAALPVLAELQADPLEVGKRLTQALGGAALFERLAGDPEGLLWIDADEGARTIPWEYAALPDRQLLAVRYPVLRLVDRLAAPPAPGPLNFVALAADPLVDAQGQPRENYRLQVDHELREVRRILQASGLALQAQRVPPLKAALKRALLRGPALLHLTCHGTVVTTPGGPLAILLLEDADGKEDRLLGSDLVLMPPRGVLQGVVLSACHAAQGTEADLAYALVRNGVPFALGMQGAFPDPLSDELAVAFYETLLAGFSVAEALRQARQTLFMNSPEAAGLPVVYAAHDSWRPLPLPLQGGQPLVGGLGLPGQAQLTSEVQPPRPLLGRNRELHELAQLYSAGWRVVTVNGSGGVGKTALAAAFAERFAWRWPQGVRTVSFASDVVNAAAFRGALLRALRGDAEALAAADAETQLTALLAAARDWDGLLLLDHYESVLQGVDEHGAEAGAIHRLVAQLAEGGLRLLLTSRQQPAHLRGEVLYPGHNDPLAGLKPAAAAGLFLELSGRAKDRSPGHLKLAADISRATEGHPLAIALLAGEYDDNDAPAPAAFLADWQTALGEAERAGLAGHHRTFGAAFARSYDRLPPDRQGQLRALSVFGFPFFAQGAALVWGQSADDLTLAKEGLAYFTNRNLLEVDGRFEDQTPATYRFHPALRQELTYRTEAHPAERAKHLAGYATYGFWLGKVAYDQITREPQIARLAYRSMDALDKATEALQGSKQLWHILRNAWIKSLFGDIDAALQISEEALNGLNPESTDFEMIFCKANLLYELGRLQTLKGEFDDALEQYTQSLLLLEKLEGMENPDNVLDLVSYSHIRPSSAMLDETPIKWDIVERSHPVSITGSASFSE